MPAAKAEHEGTPFRKMVRVGARSITLFASAVLFLIFGNRDLWRKLEEAGRQREASRRMAEEARIASSKPFEVQELHFDPASAGWKNPHAYFQPVHVGNVNFKALRPKSTGVETNDDENASDTF